MKIIATLLLSSVVLAATPQDTADIGREWIDAVRTHRAGTNDEPAARVATWTLRDLDRALKYFGDLDDAEVNALAVRGAMLHADIAIWQWDAEQGLVRRPPASAEGARGADVVIVIDGRYVGTSNIGAHWSFARRIVDRMRPSPAGHELVRLWYRGTIAYLLGNNSYTEGLPHIKRARSLFPRDAFLALASGCASETLASARIQDAARSLATTRSTQVGVSSAATHLREAEAAFRAALALDPTLDEARLRLGRVLALRGDARDALRQLDAVLASATDPILRYYAYLLLGERHEAARRDAAARDAYEQASRLFPTAQSPLLGLSHVARRGGDRAAARSAVARLAALPARSDERDDPWWYYDLGPGRDAQRLLAELQAALR